MDIKITEEKDNPLLSRKEIKADITFNAVTPSNSELAKKIASLTKADESLVKVNRIKAAFGETTAKVEAVVYNSKKGMEYVERKSRKERKAEKEAAKKPKEEGAEAPAEAPKEEAKPEEKPKEKSD